MSHFGPPDRSNLECPFGRSGLGSYRPLPSGSVTGHRGRYVTKVRNCLSRSIKPKMVLRRYFTGLDTKSSVSLATNLPIGTDGF